MKSPSQVLLGLTELIDKYQSILIDPDEEMNERNHAFSYLLILEAAHKLIDSY